MILIILNKHRDHISNLVVLSIFINWCALLKIVRSSVSCSVFAGSRRHVYDYSNSILIDLPRLFFHVWSRSYTVNAAAILIPRLPGYSRISTFMFDHLHWLPLSQCIKFKVPIFWPPRHNGDLLQYIWLIYSTYNCTLNSFRVLEYYCPLRSSRRLDPLVPYTITRIVTVMPTSTCIQAYAYIQMHRPYTYRRTYMNESIILHNT